MSEASSMEIHNREIEKLLQQLAVTINADIPKGWGFTLCLYEFSPGDSFFYISNGQREQMVKALTQLLGKIGGVA